MSMNFIQGIEYHLRVWIFVGLGYGAVRFIAQQIGAAPVMIGWSTYFFYFSVYIIGASIYSYYIDHYFVNQ